MHSLRAQGVDAKATLRTFIKKFPDHARFIDARQQLMELQYKH